VLNFNSLQAPQPFGISSGFFIFSMIVINYGSAYNTTWLTITVVLNLFKAATQFIQNFYLRHTNFLIQWKSLNVIMLSISCLVAYCDQILNVPFDNLYYRWQQNNLSVSLCPKIVATIVHKNKLLTHKKYFMDSYLEFLFCFVNLGQFDHIKPFLGDHII
jgi:hypothetical protein